MIFLPSQIFLSHTFASSGSDFSEGIIALVALTTDNSSLAGALPSDGVAGSRLRAYRETVAGVTSVLSLWTIVIILQEVWERRHTSLSREETLNIT